MQAFFELFPAAIFFLCYWLSGDLILSTIILALATLGQLLAYRYRNGSYNKTQVISFIAIFFLGGATILLRNEMFIKWKPTVVYWILAAILFFSQFIGDKTAIERLLGKNLKLPSKTWSRVNLSWFLFCSLMGVSNLWIAYNFNTKVWVNFKLFGTLGLTLTFVLAQAMFLSKCIKQE